MNSDWRVNQMAQFPTKVKGGSSRTREDDYFILRIHGMNSDWRVNQISQFQTKIKGGSSRTGEDDSISCTYS